MFRATHRGTHESDLLIGGYVARRIRTLSGKEMDALEAILDLPDPDLADWLTGRCDIPPQFDTPLLRAIKEAGGR